MSPKRAWSKLVWERAWKLEDANLRASNMIFKDNDILALTVGDTRYTTWWQISDMDFRFMKMCETMSKLVCHASLLKRDDCRLKGLPMSNRTCINCYMYCIEDITHILMQCPYYQEDRNEMFREIAMRCPNAESFFEQERENIPYYLLGRKIPSYNEDEMLCLCCISGYAISRMYRKAIANRTGIG